MNFKKENMSVTPISTSWVCTHTGPKNLKIIYVQTSPQMQNNNAYILLKSHNNKK